FGLLPGTIPQVRSQAAPISWEDKVWILAADDPVLWKPRASKPCLFQVVPALALFGRPATAENACERETEDRAHIEQLMWQYVRALDTENADAYAAVYTPDGQFGSGANAVKGHEALKKMINDLRQRATEAESKSGEKRPPMYHVITNS